MRQTLFYSAIWLPLLETAVDARAHAKFPQLQVRDGRLVPEAKPVGWVDEWMGRLFKRGTCYEDSYYNFVQGLPQSFCQTYMNYPNQTVTVDTYTDTYTTEVFTSTVLVRTTPYSTTTIVQNAKRDAHPSVTPRAELSRSEMIADVFNKYRRQNAASSSSSVNDSSSMSSAFSSACSCQNYGGPTVTETYTDEATVTTLSAFAETTTTLTTTKTAVEIVATVLTTVSSATASAPNSGTSVAATSGFVSGVPAPASSASGTGAPSTSAPASSPTPVSPPFICPDDDGDVISQLVGNERFDYLVECSTDLTSSTFYGALYYTSFGQCISACSYADANFSSPVCQGASYYNAPNQDGYNCFLKTSGNGSAPMTGVDSAVLQRIVLGVDSADASGTNTESAPFATQTPTGNASMMSSSMSAAMGNSTTSMPMITPGPSIPVSGHLVNGYTSYSTIVSGGSTYSTGTVYYTSYSSNGVWYYSYYTSYSLAWASATTEYASGSQTTQAAAAGSNQTSSSQQSGGNGDYSVISTQNSTQYGNGYVNGSVVTTNQTYNANGTEISSTASTSYYSYATGGSGSGSGGAAGGNVSSTEVVSTAYFSTQTIISGSGGAAGGSGGAGSKTIATPTPSAITIVQSGGTAYSSGYLISGAITGTGGSGGGSGSGSITTVSGVMSGTAIVIVNSTGTAYSSGYLISGSLVGTGGASSAVGSGSVPTSSPSYSFSQPSAPRGPGTESSSTGGSYGLTGPSPYRSNYSGTPLSGTAPTSTLPVNSTTVTVPIGTGSSTAPLLFASFPLTGPHYGPPQYVTTSTSSPYDFSNTAPPRIPGTGSSTLPGTAPPAYTSSTQYGFSDMAPPRLPGTGSSTVPANSGSPVTSPNSTTSYGFTNVAPPRVPGTGSSTVPVGTAPTTYPSPPPFPSTCGNMTMGTTTVFQTTTVYGCYSSCAPAWGDYGGPQSFGPPVWASESASSGAAPSTTG